MVEPVGVTNRSRGVLLFVGLAILARAISAFCPEGTPGPTPPHVPISPLPVRFLNRVVVVLTLAAPIAILSNSVGIETLLVGLASFVVCCGVSWKLNAER